MLLGALQDFEWLNEPENVVFRDKAMHIVAENKTDFWQSKHHNFGQDNGHFFFTRRNDDFSLLIKWSYVQSQPYDQCGIMLRIDNNNWIKASIMYDNPERPVLGTGVTQNGYTDWAAQDISLGVKDIWFKLKRSHGDYMLYYSLDGDCYKQIRVAHLLNDVEEIKVGAYICSPKNDSFEAILSQLEFEK